MSDKGFETRKLLKENNSGVLSTISLDVEGYPFGSVTPYCLSDQLEPIILISTIAQHTKNIIANSKVSLTVFNNETEDVQSQGRVTYLGDAVLTESEADKEKYSLHFPKSKKYFEFHDFKLYKIQFKKIRFIGGFGSIHWVNAEDYFNENSLTSVKERILTHMNNDHHDSIIHYCKKYKNIETDKASIIDIDEEGIDILANENVYRISFEEPVKDAGKAREILVKMAG